MRMSGNGQSTDVKFTADSLEKGAVQIATASWGKYKDTDGQLKPVGGDFTKVRYVPTLSEAAHALLRNIEHASRSLPGTQETRRMMRFATQAYRIKYGTPIFVTFSPDESQSLLMVRMSRTRRNDPVFLSTLSSRAKHFSGADSPDLSTHPDDVLFEVSVKDWIHELPDYNWIRRHSYMLRY